MPAAAKAGRAAKGIAARRGVPPLVLALADLVLAAPDSADRALVDLALVVALAVLALVGPALADLDSVLRANVPIAMMTMTAASDVKAGTMMMTTIAESVSATASASGTRTTTRSDRPAGITRRPAACGPS